MVQNLEAEKESELFAGLLFSDAFYFIQCMVSALVFAVLRLFC